MKKRSLFLAFASMFMLASCGSNSEQEKEEVLITSVGVNPTSLELVAGSAPTEVAYRVFGRGEYDKSVSVSTSAQAVATAELVEGQERFKVTPVAVGEAVITVKSKADESKAATLNVTVKENQVKPTKPHVTNLTLDKTAARCKEGDPAIEFTVTLEGEGNFDVGFIINNEHPDLVDVDATEGASGSSFHVTPKAAGTALIDVISKENADIKQQIQVLIDPVIPEPERVVITTEPLRKLIDINEEFNITVKEHTHPVEWSVTQEGNIVELSNQSDDSVTVKTLAYGEAKVTATVRGSEEIVSSDTYIEVVESGEFKGYKAILDGSIEISLVKGEPGRSGVVEHYEATLSDVSAGTRIDFAGITKGGYDLITNGIGPDADDKDGGKRNNLKPTAAGQVDFTVQNDITSEKLYFDIWEDGGCSFWLDGGLSYVEGFFLSVNGIPTAQLVKNDQYVGEGEEYMALGVSLNANDVIALYDGSTDASWMPPLEQGGSSECFTLDKGKTVCLATATYDFYIKLIYQNDTVYVTSSEPIVEPVYTFAINGGSQITLIKCDDDKPEGVNHQYAASVSFTAGDKLTFYRDGVEFNSITVEGGNNNVNSSFEILETFAPEEGHNSIYLKHMSDSSFVLYVAGKTFVAPYKVVGIGGKWDYADGVQMVKKEGSDTEYVAEISVNALDNIKIRSDEDAWFSNWKTDCGEDNAIDNLEAYICGEEGDSKGNLIFRVAGTFKVYFETDPSNAGIYVATESVTSPYTGRLNSTVSAPFEYHNVELYVEHGGRIEYMIKDVELKQGDTLEIIKDSLAKPFTIENGGASSLFNLDETEMTYVGEEDATFSFYLKEDLEDPTKLTVFILGDTPSPTPTTTYKVVGIGGDWTFESGIPMELKEGSETEYVAEISVSALDNIKIRSDEDAWFSNWKTDCGEDNAIDNLEAYICGEEGDSKDNLIFRVAGTFKVYFETDPSNAGIYVATESVTSPYTGRINESLSAPFSYHNVELYPEHGGRIEYMIKDADLVTDTKLEILKGDVVQEIEVENGGAKELFDITETSMTYKGEGGTYTFYLKEDLEDPTELTLFIAGDTPTPVSVYNLHLNRSGDTEWVDLAMSQTEDKTTQYEIKNLELGAGDQFVVNLDGTWFNAKNLKGDNNLVNVVGDNIVIKEAGNYDIYCDTNTADGQYGIWIAKSPAPIDNTYSVKLLDNKGDLVSQESLKYKEDTGEYYIDNIALSSSYDIEFYHGDDKLAISPKDSDAENANNCAIKINTTDVLTIVRSAEAAEGKGIFLNPTEGEVWVSGNYVSLSVIIDKDTVENQLTFHKNDVDGSGNAYTEYSFTFEEIEDNKEIHFFKNGLAINAGPEAGEGNNAESAKWQGIFDCCTVKKGGKNLTVYLKVFENGSYSVWVGEAKGEIVTKTYTITCDQTGAFDNCEVFIWAWGDGVDGKFYATYVVAGKYGLSFDVPEGVDHFLVVRCYVGTTQPSWDEKGDAPGRIYNQTADITIDSMTTTYPITFPNW